MRSERGASAVEYAVMVATIAAVILLAISFLGRSASSTFSCVGRATAGNTCVQAVQILVVPSPSHTCRSQNGAHGIGCVGQ